MWNQIKNNRFVLLLLLTGAVYFFLEYISPLVGPILIATLFVTIFGPLLKKMQERFHVHRQIGAVFLLILGILFVFVLSWILYSWIFGNVPVWTEHLLGLQAQLQVLFQRSCQLVGNLVGVDGAYLEKTISRSFAENFGNLGKWNVTGMLTHSLEYVKLLGEIGVFLLTFLIATVLLAKDYDEIMNQLLDKESCHVLLEVICGVIRYLATYVKAQLTIMLVNSIVSATVLGIFRIYNGVLWGILAGITDALPLLGTGIVLVPLAFSQLFAGTYGKAIVCFVLYGVCMLIRQVLEPKLIGRHMGVPPIAVLLSLYAGVKLFGLMGIIKGPLGFVLIRETYLSLRKT